MKRLQGIFGRTTIGFTLSASMAMFALSGLDNAQAQERQITPSFSGTDVWEVVGFMAVADGRKQVVRVPGLRAHITLKTNVSMSYSAFRDAVRFVFAENGLELVESSDSLTLRSLGKEAVADRVAFVARLGASDAEMMKAHIRQQLSQEGVVTYQTNGSLLIVVDGKENVDRAKEVLGSQ